MAAATGWAGHNTVWRFEADSGTWAVKEIGREPGPQIEAAASLEAAAHVAGIPSPRPIQTLAGSWLATIRGRAFRCHEWMDGECPTDSLTAKDARIAGGVLGQVHELRLPREDGQAATFTAWGEIHWRGLAEKASSLGLDW